MIQYSLNEITLLPSACLNDINSRSEVNPFTNTGNLPVFVSPMTSIIDDKNYTKFISSKFIPILPRNINFSWDKANIWQSVSLEQFKTLFNIAIESKKSLNGFHILIDMANGHLKCLYDAVRLMKHYFPNIIIMIGNIAHPQIYTECCDAGVDFCRIGIGGGSVCSTSVGTAIHTSHHYMIENIKKLPCFYKKNRTKLIADGGINTIGKAIKCLGMGYDYVMIGQMFAQCAEACGEIVLEDNITKRKYYGMSSREGQRMISNHSRKNPEGIEKLVVIDTTLPEFSFKFESFLRSAMSYTGAKTLEQFRTETQYMIQSIEEFKSYDK